MEAGDGIDGWARSVRAIEESAAEIDATLIFLPPLGNPFTRPTGLQRDAERAWRAATRAPDYDLRMNLLEVARDLDVLSTLRRAPSSVAQRLRDTVSAETQIIEGELLADHLAELDLRCGPEMEAEAPEGGDDADLIEIPDEDREPPAGP